MATFEPGTILGSYEVLSLLGAGGMGEVYRAHDSKLRREVAIKVLPEIFANDVERVARFHREAQAVAALNHPNIGAIYGLEDSASTKFLVLELVEGETLADRIHRGHIPIEEVLSIARQIAEALEAAHEKGVVHRDLKPANVKITPEGKVKVLDFGLAKALDNSAASANLSQSPTLSIAGTQAGVILGTAAYMSPEQAKGFNSDHRSDIFSFGAVLYEMLTGRQPFEGDSISEVLASVIKMEADFTLLPKNLHPRLVELLRRCLVKNPKGRWHAAADVRVEIEAIASSSPEGLLVDTYGHTAKRPLWRRAAPAVVALLLGGLIAGTAVWRLKPSPSLNVSRFAVLLPEGQVFTAQESHILAISPDGTQFVYVANNQLFLRSMGDLEPRAIPGTNLGGQVRDPAFSPDGSELVFFSAADSTLKRIALAGGSAVTICPSEFPLGISWEGEDILFATTAGGPGSQIKSVSRNGGTPEVLVSFTPGEAGRFPQLLPGGKALLYSVGSQGQWERAQVVVQRLGSMERTTIIPNGTDARYLPTGHIVYGMGGTLFAVPFDAGSLQTTGPAVPVMEGIKRSANSGTYQVSISKTGQMVFIPGSAGPELVSLVRMDRSGGIRPIGLPAGNYAFPRISHDGARVAYTVDDGKEANVWVYELSGKGPARRLTFGGANRYPVWSWNDDRIAFQSDRDGVPGIFWQRSDFTGTAEPLTKPEKDKQHIPDSWSPDGRHISYTELKLKTPASSVWVVSTQDKKAMLFADAPSGAFGRSAFHPDGRWLAYQSTETGAAGVFVQPFPAEGSTRHLIARRSVNTPHHPQWSRDGKELFYIPGAAQFSVVSVTTTRSVFTFSNPSVLPATLLEGGPSAVRGYDVFPDGKEFIGTVSSELGQNNSPGARRIVAVLNWFSELQQHVPVK